MKSIGLQKTGIVFSVALHLCCFALVLSLPKERFLSESEPIQVSLESLGSPVPSGGVEKKRQRRPGPVRQRPVAAPAPPVEARETFEPESPAVEALQSPPEMKAVPAVAAGPATASPDAAKVGTGETVPNPKRQAETMAEAPGGAAVVEAGLGMSGGPSFIHRVDPVYPPLARRMGREGLVVLKLLIDRHGKLQSIEVVESSGHGFLDAAIKAVRQSTYAPARRNGQAVSAKAVLPIRFRLD